MLTKLFWPKELKVLVKQYRADNSLNPRPLKIVRNHQFVALLLGSGLAFILFKYDASWHFYIINAIIAYVIHHYFLKEVLNNCIIPYTIGRMEKGSRSKIYRGAGNTINPFGHHYWYWYLDNNKKRMDIGSLEEKEQLQGQGENIDLLIHPEKDNYYIPYIPEWEDKYRLTYAAME